MSILLCSKKEIWQRLVYFMEWKTVQTEVLILCNSITITYIPLFSCYSNYCIVFFSQNFCNLTLQIFYRINTSVCTVFHSIYLRLPYFLLLCKWTFLKDSSTSVFLLSVAPTPTGSRQQVFPILFAVLPALIATTYVYP